MARRRRMNMGRFRKLVKAAISSTHASRVRFMNTAIPTASTTDFSLMTCDDDPNYDLTSDGTNVAECQPFSRITKIDLMFRLEPAAGNTVEWLIYKDPDGTISGMSPSTLFTSDVSFNTMTLRRYALAYGWFKAVSGIRDARIQRIFIKRKALRRAGLMHDGDLLRLAIANPSAGAGEFILTGKIYTAGR